MTTRWLPGAAGPADAPRRAPDEGGLEHLGGPPPAPEEAGLPVPWAISASAHHLKEAGAELRRLPVEVRIAALARVGRAWRDPDDEHRQEALDLLPSELGFTPEMVAWAIDAAFDVLTVESLQRWWDREGHAPSSTLSAHIQAGNVFVAGLPPVIASVLAGVPALIKAPSAAPTFPALFARSVARLAPELGPCVGSTTWSRVDRRTTQTLLNEADVAYAFGDDDSIAAVQALSETRVHGFGHRVSVALIPADQPVTDAVIDGLATDALAYDGAGCLTPRWVLVEGDLETATAWARAAASRLPAVNDLLPALPLDAGSGAARAQYLGVVGFSGFAAHDAGWAVTAQPHLDPAPPPRTLCFVPVAALDAVPDRLAPLGSTLQGLALAGAPDPDSGVFGPHGLDLPAPLAPLTARGLSLVTRPGLLQRPPLDWNHDDVRILAAL